MRKKELQNMNEQFQVYLFSLEDSLVELENFIQKNLGKKQKHLDYSFESLGIVEKLLGEVLDGMIEIDIPLDMLLTRVSTYMGEIVRKNRGGQWELCVNKRDYDYGYPQIGKMDGFIESYAFCPINVVYNYKAHRKKESLPDAVKHIVEFDYSDYE